MRYFIYHSVAKSQKKTNKKEKIEKRKAKTCRTVAKSQPERPGRGDCRLYFTKYTSLFRGFCSVPSAFIPFVTQWACNADGRGGFTWLQNKLIQNQPATSRGNGKRTWKSVVKQILAKCLRLRFLLADSLAVLFILFLCEVRLQPDLGTPPTTTPTTSIYTLTQVSDIRCFQCWITQLISVTWFTTFRLCCTTTLNFNFIYLHFYEFHYATQKGGSRICRWWSPTQSAIPNPMSSNWDIASNPFPWHLRTKISRLLRPSASHFRCLGNVLLA